MSAMAPRLTEREGQRQVVGLQAHLNTAHHRWLGFGRLSPVVRFSCSSPDDTALIQSRSRTSVQALRIQSAQNFLKQAALLDVLPV